MINRLVQGEALEPIASSDLEIDRSAHDDVPVVLNLQRGLQILSDPVELGRLLRKYLLRYGNVCQQISAADSATAAALAHKAKGAAAQLGLDAVAALAGRVEHGLKGGVDMREALVELQAALAAANTAVEGYVGTADGAPDRSTQEVVADKVALAAELTRLLRALDSDDMSRVEPILSVLESWLPAELVLPLKTAIESYDFRGAEVSVHELSATLKIELKS